METTELTPRMDSNDYPAWGSILESIKSEVETRPFTDRELEKVERYHNSPRKGKYKNPPKYRVIRLDGLKNGEVIGFERPRNEFYASLATQLENWISGEGTKSSFDFPFSDKQWKYVERIAGDETIGLYEKINSVILTCPHCLTQIEAYTMKSLNLKCLACEPGCTFLTPADMAEHKEYLDTPQNNDEFLDADINLETDDDLLFVD